MKAPEPRFLLERSLVAVSCRAPAEDVRDALARQGELRAPAKLALLPDGEGALLAEAVPNGDPGEAKRRAVRDLDDAWRWLNGSRTRRQPQLPAGRLPDGDGDGDRDLVAAVLDELPWPWEECDDERRLIHASERGAECRLELRWRDRHLHVSAQDLVLTAENGRVGAALASFALGANRRLRLARLTVAPAGGTNLRAQWDAVVPFGAALERTLAMAVAAVIGARAETARPLRALSQPAAAEAYLRLNDQA